MTTSIPMQDTPASRGGARPSTPVMIRLNDDLHDLQVQDPRRTASKGSYIVISGGTAANDFVQAFGRDCAFVLPGKPYPRMSPRRGSPSQYRTTAAHQARSSAASAALPSGTFVPVSSASSLSPRTASRISSQRKTA